TSPAHVIGLCCGGGQKDSRLLMQLAGLGRQIIYTPCDVSTAMVLVARQAALSVVADENCLPFVCDLASADDLPDVFATRHPSPVTRLITFFGMRPNFEPDRILPKLAKLVRPHDQLLLSANLAPGPDYAAGVQLILPQYDNEPTRDWLMTFLLDLGVERADGELRFAIEDEISGSGLKKIVARFHFTKPRRIEAENEVFDFHAGGAIQLFFSYRYTPARVREMLRRHALTVTGQWIVKSGEECVFLCRRLQSEKHA
ncbi:MAG: L-histidine N(alpha)-methyltransferase, partial [Verrucomicrobiota bacterium]